MGAQRCCEWLSAEPNRSALAFTITDLEDNYLGHIHFN